MFFPSLRGPFAVVPCPRGHPTKQPPPALGSEHLPAFALPQFPREARQLPALTLLAAGRLQHQKQPQEEEEEGAGRHGGRQGHGGAAESGPCSQGVGLGHAALPQE